MKIWFMLALVLTACGGKSEVYTRSCLGNMICPLGTYCAQADDNSPYVCSSCATAPGGHCEDGDCVQLKDGQGHMLPVCSGVATSCSNPIEVGSKICPSGVYCSDHQQCMNDVDAGS